MAGILDSLKYYWTLWEWKRRAHKRQRPHIAIGSVSDFFQQLNSSGAVYAVLRWFDWVPLNAEDEAKCAESGGDLDILADAESLPLLCRAVATHPGKVGVDLYSNSLILGTDVKRFTYYPPVLCKDLLDHRILSPQGYYRPDDMRYLFSLAYHLVYHKGQASGFPTGFPDLPQQPKESDRHDPEGTLRNLANACGMELPRDLTLLNLHLFLKSHGWNMPLDLLLRWPKRHALLDSLYKHESQELRKALNGHQNLSVYLLREDAIKAGATEDILDGLKEHYNILDTIRFTPEQQNRVIRRTRGGNWTKRKQTRLYLPEIAVVCQSKEAFTPIDDRLVATAHVTYGNPDLLFKHALREKLAAKYPEADAFVHGSDNDIESMEYIQAIYGNDWPEAYAKLFSQTTPQ